MVIGVDGHDRDELRTIANGDVENGDNVLELDNFSRLPSSVETVQRMITQIFSDPSEFKQI